MTFARLPLGRILLDYRTLAEIEINPLRASASGALALDALAVAGKG